MSQKQILLTIENEVTCRFEGLDKIHLEMFVQAYSIYTKDYYFNPVYKLGNWDGKIRYFSWKGQTYVTLMPEIIPVITKLGYDIVVDDQRTAVFFEPTTITADYFAHIVHPERGEPIVLRDYQVDFTNKLMSEGAGIGVAATSSGKAQPLFCKVLTPNGFILMGDIKVGDKVLTPTGEEANVVGVYPQDSPRSILQIEMVDGAVTYACLEHLWKIYISDSDVPAISTTKRIEELLEEFDVYLPTMNSTEKRQISKVTRVHGSYQVQCIAIDSEEHLYITDGYIVTHNTYMCGAMVRAYDEVNATSAIIVPSKDLINQTRRELADLEIETGEYSGNVKDVNGKNIVVTTWQSLKNNPTVLIERDAFIVDECHGGRASVLQELLVKHGKNIPHRFGVTGTMPEHPNENMAVRVAIGNVKDTISAASLIERGVLATLKINVLQLVEDLQPQYEQYCETYDGTNLVPYKQFKQQYFPDYTSEKNYLNSNQHRSDWITTSIETFSMNGNVLVLVQNIKMGKTMAKMMPDARFIHGKDDDTIRSEAYELFKNNDNIVVIATYGIASTGISINRIYELVLIDAGKSFERVIQSIGRGLRTAKDKKHVNVRDICSDLTYSKKHLTKRKSMYKKASYPFSVSKVDYMKHVALSRDPM